MNQDFRISVGFFAHRKTIRLRRELGDAGIVALIQLWSHTATQNWDGNLVGFEDKDLSFAAGWKKNPRIFCEKLVEIGFIDPLPEGGFAIHDWRDWNGFAADAEKRIERARKAGIASHSADSRRAKSSATSNAMSSAMSSAPGLCPLPPDPPDPPSLRARAGLSERKSLDAREKVSNRDFADTLTETRFEELMKSNDKLALSYARKLWLRC